MTIAPYSKYKSSGNPWFPEIPSGWTVCKLKHVVEARRPITYGIVQAGPDCPGGVPYVRPADMSDEKGVQDESEVLRTAPEVAAAYRRSELRAGDLVCSIGPSFGKVMVVPEWLEGGNLTQGTARVAVSSENNPRYIFWTLRSAIAVAQWEAAIGGATFRALNLEPLAETVIPSPPRREQEQIARFLDDEVEKIDQLIAEQELLIALLKEKRRALISAAVTGQIRVP